MDRIFARFPRLFDVRVLTAAFAAVLIATTFSALSQQGRTFNNYSIFCWSFHNLAAGVDLYSLHPDQHQDLFKYSPTFALFMAPFWYLPRWAGLLSWNLLNGLIVFWAVGRLELPAKQKAFVLLFVLLELFGSIQNVQSNGLMAGLMIGSFSAFEKRQPILAAVLICLGVYVKLFAVVAGLLFVFYPQKLRFLAAGIVAMALLAILPLLVTTSDQLIAQYQSWLELLARDPAHEMNYSWMTLTQKWFQFTAPDSYYLVPGGLLLLLPLLRKTCFPELSFRLTYLAAILVWVVIFNHKAESPTYVIAVCGVALWSVCETNDRQRQFMLWFVFVFTILSASDVFPSYVKVHIWQPWCLKALPCLVVWMVMTWKLLAGRNFAGRTVSVSVEKSLPAEIPLLAAAPR